MYEGSEQRGFRHTQILRLIQGDMGPSVILTAGGIQRAGHHAKAALSLRVVDL
jgi:hypothetical protein